MDESYLTGEPYRISKAPGSACFPGAINGETALTIRADQRAVDSRYAKIMQVMRDSEQHRPRLRRLGDQLGAYYTPLAVAIAVVRLGGQRRIAAVPGGTRRRHALPAADRHSGRHPRRDLALGRGGESSSKSRPCSRRSTRVELPSSTKRGR